MAEAKEQETEIDDGSMKKSEEQYKGSVVSFHNLFYEVNVSAGCCKTKPSTIINDVSGIFKPGTMNAIMGPTGSGKSSLLDILAARKDPNGLTGKVLIDGHPQPSNFRLMSGYVVQDDVVMGTLSIRENLRFSADLRCPQEMSPEERAAKVERVIEELSLELCADTRCGDEFTRGVSGGERKRCNVGMELITTPGVLFLDEPTTGLDSSTANSVMLNLKKLAEHGSTIIFSIHQPRYSIFKLCDSLCLLGNGEVVYHGPAIQGLDFFSSLGYDIEEHDNPADFFLDVILGNKESSIPEIEQENSRVPTKTDDVAVLEAQSVKDIADSNAERIKQISVNLSRRFKDSEWAARMNDEVSKYEIMFSKSGENLPDKEKFKSLSYNTGLFSQFYYVCGRTFKNLIRDPRNSVIQIATTCFLALINGAIYFQIPEDCTSGVQNRVGAFFFMVMNMIFSNLSAINLFISERKIFIHENVSGFYRVSAFFFAKIFCDFLPNRSIPVIGYGIITYWMIGYVARWQNFLIYLLILVLTTLCSTSVAFVASASTRTAAIANIVCAMIFVFQMLFGGLLVNLSSLGDWISWARYISIFSYALRALQINEFRDIDLKQTIYYGDLNVTVSCVKGNKDAWLERNDIAYETEWDLWQNIFALGAIIVGLLFVAYIQLRRVPKLK